MSDCCSSAPKKSDCCSSSSDNKKKKNLDYIVVIVFVSLIVGSLAVFFSLSSSKQNIVDNDLDLDLDQYRSNSIPEDCRLPIYESRIESWKEHLSHHQNTLYCLDYFD